MESTCGLMQNPDGMLKAAERLASEFAKIARVTIEDDPKSRSANTKDLIKSVFAIATTTEQGKSILASMGDYNEGSMQSVKHFTMKLTNGKYADIEHLMASGDSQMINEVARKAHDMTHYIASMWTGPGDFTNSMVGDATKNIFQFHYLYSKAGLSRYGLSNVSFYSDMLEKRFELFINRSRLFSMYEPINELYFHLNDINASAPSHLNNYSALAKRMFEKFSSGKEHYVDADTFDVLFQYSDFSKLPGYTRGESIDVSRDRGVAFVKKYISDKDRWAGQEEQHGTIAAAIFNDIVALRSEWDLINLGTRNTDDWDKWLDLDHIRGNKDLNSVLNIGEKDNMPCLAKFLVDTGTRLAAIAQKGLDEANPDEHLQKIIDLFGPNGTFKLYRFWVPSSSGDDSFAGMVTDTGAKTNRMTTPPKVLEERYKIYSGSEGVRFSDMLNNNMKVLNQFITSRTEYVVAKAMLKTMQDEKYQTIMKNMNDGEAHYDAMRFFADHLIDGALREHDTDSWVHQSVKNFFGGYIGLLAGLTLTRSAPVNKMAGYFTSGINVSRTQRRAMYKEFESSLASPSEMEYMVANNVQRFHAAHRMYSKQEQMIFANNVPIREIAINNFSSNMRRLKVDELYEGFKRVGQIFGAAKEDGVRGFMLEGTEVWKEGTTRVTERLLSHMFGLPFFSHRYVAFNPSEKSLFDPISKGYMHTRVVAQTRAYIDAVNNERVYSNGAKMTDAETKQLADEYSWKAINDIAPNIFTFAKDQGGDFSPYAKPLWSWEIFRDADNTMAVLAGAALTTMYMFKHVAQVNHGVLTKYGLQFLNKPVGTREAYTGGINAFGSAMVTSLLTYHMFNEFAEQTDTWRPPQVRLLLNASPWQDAGQVINLMRASTSVLNNEVTTKENAEKIYDAFKYIGGIFLGQGMRDYKSFQSSAHEYGALSAVVKQYSESELSFGYNFTKRVFGGLFDKIGPNDWSWRDDLNDELNNWGIWISLISWLSLHEMHTDSY